MSRERECGRKVRYTTRRDARAAMKRVGKKGKHLAAYTCAHCGWWHFGHWTPFIRR